MKTLFVLYDAKCALCRRCRGWLGRQATFVPLKFVPADSPEAEIRFRGISALHPEERLIVVSDEGDVWQGEDAWIMCLWALREYREWAMRLANPLLKPFARQVCAFISENRFDLSRWILNEPIEHWREHFASSETSDCGQAGYCKPR